MTQSLLNTEPWLGEIADKQDVLDNNLFHETESHMSENHVVSSFINT